MASKLSAARNARLQWALNTQTMRVGAYSRELDKRMAAERAAQERRTLLLWVVIAALSVAVAIARIWSQS